MFCRLHLAKIATKLEISDFEVCEAECPHYNGELCKVSETSTTCLSKEKFGWRLNIKIHLLEPVPSKSENTYYCGLIQLIHPTYSDIWIIQSLKKDKETEAFLVYQDGKLMDTCDSFKPLRDVLKSKYHYNGRKFNYDDFKVGETDV